MKLESAVSRKAPAQAVLSVFFFPSSSRESVIKKRQEKNRKKIFVRVFCRFAGAVVGCSAAQLRDGTATWLGQFRAAVLDSAINDWLR